METHENSPSGEDIDSGELPPSLPPAISPADQEVNITPTTVLNLPAGVQGSLQLIEVNFPGVENITRFTHEQLEAFVENLPGDQIGMDLAANMVLRGLMNNGEEIAVKCYRTGKSSNVEQWKSEIQYLAMPEVANNPNIIRLLGYCQTNWRLYLVYPWMAGGSLQQRIAANDPELNWERTLNILKGIANGIQVLHSQVPPLIHRDLKLPNILLDQDWRPVLCDFGTVGPRGEGVHGYTTGYADLATESGKADTYSDIFSLGISILQVIMRKEHVIVRRLSQEGIPAEQQDPIHVNRKEEQCILSWARAAAKGPQHVVADFLMQGEGGCSIRAAKKITKLAFKCSKHDSKKRPDIHKVTYKLYRLDEPISIFGQLKEKAQDLV